MYRIASVNINQVFVEQKSFITSHIFVSYIHEQNTTKYSLDFLKPVHKSKVITNKNKCISCFCVTV